MRKKRRAAGKGTIDAARVEGANPDMAAKSLTGAFGNTTREAMAEQMRTTGQLPEDFIKQMLDTTDAVAKGGDVQIGNEIVQMSGINDEGAFAKDLKEVGNTGVTYVPEMDAVNLLTGRALAQASLVIDDNMEYIVDQMMNDDRIFTPAERLAIKGQLTRSVNMKDVEGTYASTVYGRIFQKTILLIKQIMTTANPAHMGKVGIQDWINEMVVGGVRSFFNMPMLNPFSKYPQLARALTGLGVDAGISGAAGIGMSAEDVTKILREEYSIGKGADGVERTMTGSQLGAAASMFGTGMMHSQAGQEIEMMQEVLRGFGVEDGTANPFKMYLRVMKNMNVARDNGQRLRAFVTFMKDGDDPVMAGRVLGEVAESFLNFGVVARREAEQQAELKGAPDVLVTVPFFDADIYDMGGLLRLGALVWE